MGRFEAVTYDFELRLGSVLVLLVALALLLCLGSLYMVSYASASQPRIKSERGAKDVSPPFNQGLSYVAHLCGSRLVRARESWRTKRGFFRRRAGILGRCGTGMSCGPWSLRGECR